MTELTTEEKKLADRLFKEPLVINAMNNYLAECFNDGVSRNRLDYDLQGFISSYAKVSGREEVVVLSYPTYTSKLIDEFEVSTKQKFSETSEEEHFPEGFAT